jgi:CheY-like chemotaxis protein
MSTIVHADIEAKQQEFDVTSSLIHPDVFADRLRLNQIMLNIVSNAMKYTPRGGRISVSVRELGSALHCAADYQLRVTDSGIGMSEEFQKVIFDAFTRENTTTVNKIQGTGLGMAITKRMVDMMGGTISVKSEQGKGSEFTVVIPFRINDKSPAPAPAPAAEAAPEGNDVFDGKRILLAEDTETNQMIAEAILTGVGLEVEIANDGAEALSMVSSKPAGYYNLVLMDIQMPNMDGYEATRQIRAMEDPIKSRIPIVAMTANAFAEDRQMAIDVGMDDHVTKPYDIPRIMEVLGRLLKE